MRAIDKARWLALSPLLDEMLDLEPVARAARLAALRAEDGELALDLEELLGRLPAMEREAFLEQPARVQQVVDEALRDASLAGQSIGPYTVERELGTGGMGSVWLARRTDGRYEGEVAIKFLNAGLVARGGAERFAREGSILARLAHPHIARLLDAGVARDGTQPYLVLEYIDGEPIDRYCDGHALDAMARVRLFLDVLAAVAHAHNRLILHRDLKPSNILVTAAGDVKLLDFGIAKLLGDEAAPAPAGELTQQAGRAFTPQYAAPEQLQGGDVTTATDVYALGVLLYVLLGGVHPTAAATTTPLDQMRAVIEGEPRRLSDAVARKGGTAARKLARELRGDLDNIVARALKKTPGERYANAAAFADDLRRHLNHEPVTARPDTPAYLFAKFVRRHRLGVAAGTLVASALAAGIGIALWQAKEAHRQRVQAEGLIEFMLGDLRKKLQPVGRLDVLDAVGEKALAYYAAQDAGGLDADALGRKARALHLIGEIAEQRGSLDEASRVLQRAAESTAELMARDPHNAQRIFDHAQSVYWVGYMQRKRGQAAQAEASFREYLELAERLRQLDPDKVDWRIEKAYASQNLGVVFLDRSRPDEALQVFSQTRDAWLDIVAARPELNFELANAWGWIAKVREAQGEFAAALDAQRAKIDVLHKVPNAAKNRRVDRLLANAEHEIGRLQLSLGHAASAEQAARDALTRYEALSAQDAENAEWLAQTTFARLGLVETELALGERDDARTQLARAASDTQRLLAADATKRDWHIRLKGRLLLMTAQVAPGDAAAAGIKNLDAYLASVARFEAPSNAPDVEQARVVSADELLLGDLLSRGAQPALAQPHWRAAAGRVQASATHGDLPAMTLLAQAQLRLGAMQEARTLAERIEASPYRHPAYADLRRRLAAAAGAAPVP